MLSRNSLKIKTVYICIVLFIDLLPIILNNMWPMLLDLSEEECKRILRRLELEAYSNIVSTLRAQGALNKEKKKLLQDLAGILNISLERHRAEVRRAVNDEKLATIAEYMAGPNTSTEWAIEGRRLIPLMPRLVPQTAFTALANKMADFAVTENAKLPPPTQTLKLKESFEGTLSIEDSWTEMAYRSRNSVGRPASNKHALKHTEEDGRVAKRQRCSSSTELISSGCNQVMSPLVQEKVLEQPSIKKVTQITQTTKPPVVLLQSQLSGNSQVHSQLASLSQAYPQHCESAPSQQIILQQTPALTQSAHLPPHQRIQSQHEQKDLQQQQQVIQPQEQCQKLEEQEPQQKAQKPPYQASHNTSQSQQLLQPSVSHINQEQNKDAQTLSNTQVQMTSMKVQEVALSTPSYASNHSRMLSGGSGNTPVKITLTSSAGRSTLSNIATPTTTTTTPTLTTTSPAPTTQKVIIVQSSGSSGGPGPPSILQRSLTVPVVKTSQAAAVAAVAASASGGGSSVASRTSLIISGHCSSPPVTPTTIVTISTNPVNSNNVTNTTGGVATTAYISSPGSIPHSKPKAVQLSSRMRPRTGSIVIPVTPNSLGGAPVTLKTTSMQTSRPGLHVKTECSGMKIVPVPASATGTTKILPKPPFGSGNNTTPMYMMNNTSSSITMVTRTMSASCTGSRMITVNATTLPSSTSCVQGRPAATTLVSKAVSAAALSRSPAPGKSNVIVVQKGPGGTFPRGVSVSGGKVQSFPASLQEVLSKVVGNKSLGVSASGSGNTPIVTAINLQKAQQQSQPVSTNTQTGNVVVLDLSHENISKNTVLADILQASGITNEADPDNSVSNKGEKLHEKCLASENSTFSTPVVVHPNTQVNKSSSGASTQQSAVGDVEADGELDPQTGIYSVHSESASQPSKQNSSVTILPTGSVDIFSTAIASADINLDSFQYMEDGAEGTADLCDTVQPNDNVAVTVDEGRTQVHTARDQLCILQDTEMRTEEPTAVSISLNHPGLISAEK